MFSLSLVSLIIILAIGIGLILFVGGVFLAFPKINRIVTSSLWCPVPKRRVTAEFQEDPWSGKRVEVNSCTAFSPATAIECDKACLGVDELPAPADPEERPREPGVMPGRS